MTMTDYCRKQKVLADELNALGTTITDKRLVQNTLRGLGSKLAPMPTLTLKQRPLPPFLEVHATLLLEGLTLQQSESSSTPSRPSAFVACGAPPTPPRPPADNTVPQRRPDICRNFQRFSNCRFEARCRFLHSAPLQPCGGMPANPGKAPQAPWPSM
jgi:hypothetical protein